MSNTENLDKTNKWVNPEDISKSDDEVIRQLSENLQGVTTEDIEAMCDEMDEAKKRAEKIKSILAEMNWTKIEEKINGLSEDEFVELIWTLWI